MDLDRLKLDRKLKGCPECGHTVDYKGLGEYYCPGCKKIVYDDYGKVRVFIEEYPAANINQVAEGTGVDKSTIKEMVREGKFVIRGATNSLT